ncbi:MAG: protein kinase [Phycisphaerales bacterium]|nr:protein kinase [Phycisphaerales bacterium]
MGVGDEPTIGPSHRSHALPREVFVPGYQIVEELKRGGQGVVYRAVQDDTRRTVALKMLLSGRLASARERFRFEREIEIAASLRHANIVTVYEAVESSDGRRGYAMELIEGSPIDVWAGITELEPPPPRAMHERLRALAKVCRTVQYAHGLGVIHRDLKPGNIIIDGNGEPHILDFGLAKRFFSDPAQPPGEGSITVVSLAGVFEGTPAYASPEQVDGRRPEDVDARSDVYSLGVIAYRLVVGRFPYPVGGSLRDVFNTICTRDPDSPREAARTSRLGGVPSDLETILLKALSKDRDRRYQTAAALANDLEHFLANEAIEARRDSTLYIIRKSAWKHRRLLAISALLLLCTGAAMAYVWHSRSRVRDLNMQRQYESERAAVEETKRRAVAGLIDQLVPPAAGADSLSGLESLYRRLDVGMYAELPELEATVRSLLGNVFRDRGLQSMATLQKAYATAFSLRTYGPNDPRTATAYQDLAETALLANSPQYAQHSAERALSIWEGTLGQKHVQTALTQDLLARIMLRQGLAERARETHAASGDVLRTDAAGERANALTLLTEAKILLALHRPADALTSAARCLRIRFGAMSDEDPDLQESISVFAAVRTALGEGEAAKRWQSLATSLRAPVYTWSPSIWRELIAAKTEILGSDRHVGVAKTRLNYAVCISSGEVMDELHKAIPVLEQELGIGHPAVAEAYSVLRGCYVDFGRHEEALAYARLAFVNSRAVFANDSPLVDVVLHNSYANSLASCGRLDEAREVLLTGLDIALASVGASMATFRLIAALADVDLALGLYDEAQMFNTLALEMLAEVDPPNQTTAMSGRLCMVAVSKAFLGSGCDTTGDLIAFSDSFAWDLPPYRPIFDRLVARFESLGNTKVIDALMNAYCRTEPFRIEAEAKYRRYQAKHPQPPTTPAAPGT